MKKYSVIIPCYDAIESDFRRCLDSIKNQTMQPYEVICVDDCSPLDTPKIALEYGFKYIRNSENLNNGGARNVGMREATGDYLIFVNSDDYILPETIEEIDKVNNEEDLIMIGFRAFGNEDYGFTPNKENMPYMSKFSWYGEPMHIVKRDFILQNNLFEEEHINCADVQWCISVENTMKSYSYVSKELYMYQVGHETSLLTKMLRRT